MLTFFKLFWRTRVKFMLQGQNRLHRNIWRVFHISRHVYLPVRSSSVDRQSSFLTSCQHVCQCLSYICTSVNGTLSSRLCGPWYLPRDIKIPQEWRDNYSHGRPTKKGPNGNRHFTCLTPKTQCCQNNSVNINLLSASVSYAVLCGNQSCIVPQIRTNKWSITNLF